MFIIWSNRFMFLLINKVIYLTGLFIDQPITFYCQAQLQTLTSDHLAILCNLDLTVPEPITEQRLRRNINSIDKQQFSNRNLILLVTLLLNSSIVACALYLITMLKMCPTNRTSLVVYIVGLYFIPFRERG